MATAVATGLDYLESLAGEFPQLPLEAIVKEDALTEGVEPVAGLPEVVQLSGGPFELHPTIVRLHPRERARYRLRSIADGSFELAEAGSGRAVARARRYPERPAYQAKHSSAGQPLASLMDGGGRVRLLLEKPKDPGQVAEAAVETFMLESWQSHESPLAIRLQPDEAVFALADKAQERFVLDYVRAIHDALGNERPILLELPPKDWDAEMRLFEAGVTGRISAMEVWDRDAFQRVGPGAQGADRDEWIARILGQGHIYLENLAQPLLLVGKEVSQPGGIADPEKALESTKEGIRFFLKHRVCVRLAHWAGPGASTVEYHLQLAKFWYETWAHEYRAEPGGELLGPGWARDPESAFLDIGRGAGLVNLR